VGSGNETALLGYLKRQLPAFMVPARILWRDVLPVGPNGKLDRSALKAAL
jgi:acyl-CoA synthetase (AMP-forming)/AMP-acid ligase II